MISGAREMAVSVPEDATPLHVLYLVYWGATEPIGRAGTVPTVCRLASEHDEDVTLVTFDKPADVADRAKYDEVAETLASRSVRWTDLGYTKRPPGVSSFYDIARGFAACARIIRRRRIEVVHARTFVGAFIGALLKDALGVPLVVHPDGFWPEERVDDRIWREGSAQLELARRMHWHVYRAADEIIVLSRHAQGVVGADPVVAARRTPITVVQTSVDVSRFAPRVERDLSGGMRLLYLGSMGPRYLPQSIFDVFRIALDRDPRTQIRIVTKTPRANLRTWASTAGVSLDRIQIVEATNREIPAHLAWADAGVFLLEQGRSNFATSSTKVGEYLAAGLPVLISRGAGDQDDVVEETNTGVVVESTRPDELARGIERLAALAASSGVAARCRTTAEKNMGLAHCARVQATVHRRAAGRRKNQLA